MDFSTKQYHGITFLTQISQVIQFNNRKSEQFSGYKKQNYEKSSFYFYIGIATSLSFGQELQVIGSRTFDPKLVGCWKGSEKDQQQKGVSKYWISCRFEDGKSTLLFIAIYKNGKVTQTTENGKWWVENSKYYELHRYRANPFVWFGEL